MMMKLKEIRLKNFRCYEDITVPLDERLTVLVAPNGQGKTAILDAIAIALWTYVRGFDLAGNQNLNIDVDDIRIIPDKVSNNMMKRQLPTVITATDYSNYEWQRFRETERTDIDDEDNTQENLNAEEMYQKSLSLQTEIRNAHDKIINLPIFLYYGVNRGIGRVDNLSRGKLKYYDYDYTQDDKGIRTFAYSKCLIPESSYSELKRWFSMHSMQGMSKILKKITKVLNQGVDNDSLEEINNYSKKVEEPLSAIKKPVNQVLRFVGWENPNITILNANNDLSDIALNHEVYGSLKLSQLSDGIRNVFGMVADIAYRCYLLNSHFGENAAEKTEGIVLIDEVDMHLHPEWQQTILADLQKAFPKIQFIVTTHSPQVLTTVPSECIRIIDGQSIYFAPAGSKGAESSRLLNRIFGVASRPTEDENTKMLEEYRELVYSDSWNTERALQLRHQLDDIFQSEEPELTRLDLYIDNREWELRLEENQ